MAELVRLAGPLAVEGWVYGFRPEDGERSVSGREFEMLRWCCERFGRHINWDDYHLYGGPKSWSRYGVVFLFVDEDMAFEFRMRWT